MRWNYRFLFAVAPLALLVACTPQDAVTEIDRTAVAQSLDAVEAAYIAAYNGGDAAGIAALFAADGRLSPPLTPALDVAGIEEAYAASFGSGVSMTLEVTREDFVASGDMVVAWGTYTVTAASPEGEPIVSSGRYGSVSRQDPDGSLKIFRHMYNYEVPPPGLGEM